MEHRKSPNPYRQATFLISANHLHQLPDENGVEVAFAGRSNAGKSSALNPLTENRNLARTSKTPGRTQMINYFSLDEQRRLVDLPGYGFAKVPEKVKKHWQATLEGYLRQRQCLQGLVMVMDIRHPLKPFDIQMLNWCQGVQMPVHIILTKADKLKHGAACNTLQQVRRTLKQDYPGATAQLFSALKREGVEELRAVLDRWLRLGEELAEMDSEAEKKETPDA